MLVKYIISYMQAAMYTSMRSQLRRIGNMYYSRQGEIAITGDHYLQVDWTQHLSGPFLANEEHMLKWRWSQVPQLFPTIGLWSANMSFLAVEAIYIQTLQLYTLTNIEQQEFHQLFGYTNLCCAQMYQPKLASITANPHTRPSVQLDCHHQAWSIDDHRLMIVNCEPQKNDHHVNGGLMTHE